MHADVSANRLKDHVLGRQGGFLLDGRARLGYRHPHLPVVAVEAVEAEGDGAALWNARLQVADF